MKPVTLISDSESKTVLTFINMDDDYLLQLTCTDFAEEGHKPESVDTVCLTEFALLKMLNAYINLKGGKPDA